MAASRHRGTPVKESGVNMGRLAHPSFFHGRMTQRMVPPTTKAPYEKGTSSEKKRFLCRGMGTIDMFKIDIIPHAAATYMTSRSDWTCNSSDIK